MIEESHICLHGGEFRDGFMCLHFEVVRTRLEGMYVCIYLLVYSGDISRGVYTFQKPGNIGW